jgi:hypothetical protein
VCRAWAVVDVVGDESGQVQVAPGGRGCGMEAQPPAGLPQHQVREVGAGRLRPGQLQEPAAQQVADRAAGLRLPPVRDNHLPLRTLAWQLYTYGAQAARPDLPAWIEGPHHFLADQKGRLQAGRLYLTWPDGYVAASLPIQSGHVSHADLRDALAAHQLRN